MAVDLWSLTVGAKVRLEAGGAAVVVALTEDGEWIKVRYLAMPESPGLAGTEDLCSADEIAGVVRATAKG